MNEDAVNEEDAPCCSDCSGVIASYEERAAKLETALKWLIARYEEGIRHAYPDAAQQAIMMAPTITARFFLSHIDDAVLRDPMGEEGG